MAKEMRRRYAAQCEIFSDCEKVPVIALPLHEMYNLFMAGFGRGAACL